MPMLYGHDFEKIVKKILIACEYKDIPINPKAIDNGYDLLMQKKEEVYAFEIKAISSSFDKLRSIYLQQIEKIQSINSDKTVILIITDFVSIDENPQIWGINKLVELLNSISDDTRKTILFEELEHFVKSFLNISLLKNEEIQKEDSLLEEYKNIIPGKKQAQDYEKVVQKIIDHVFQNDFVDTVKKFKTENKIFEYDGIAKLIFHEGKNDFFRILEDSFKCRYVVFECKNYTDEITQKEIIYTSKYLYPKAMRSVAIIFSRKGANLNAHRIICGLLREEGKLIIVLKDEDVYKLLESPANKNTILNNILDDLLTNLDCY